MRAEVGAVGGMSVSAGRSGRVGEEDSALISPGKARIPLRTHLLALLGYTVLTLLLTWPVAAKLFTEIPGGGDAWHNLWNLWWVKQALATGQFNFYHTDLLYFPEGVNLYFHTLALTAGIMSLPLQLVGFNLLASYNLVMLSSFVLAGYGTFLLCHYLIADCGLRIADLDDVSEGRRQWAVGSNNPKSKIQNPKSAQSAIRNPLWPAFIGGIVFAFAPYHFAHMFGHLNLTMVQWIPFYVLLLLKALDARSPKSKVQSPKSKVQSPDEANDGNEEARSLTPKRRNFGLWTLDFGLRAAIGAGTLLAVNAYTDLLYAIFLLLLTGMLLLWRIALPSERRAFRAAG